MRMTKQQKMQRNIDRLANEFGVPTVRVALGCAGRMTNGLYRKAQTYSCPKGRDAGKVFQISSLITLDHKLTWATILETMAHEFAHHLANEWNLSCVGEQAHNSLFWVLLEQVRRVILPGCQYTTLEFDAVNCIDKSWK